MLQSETLSMAKKNMEEEEKKERRGGEKSRRGGRSCYRLLYKTYRLYDLIFTDFFLNCK